MPIKFNEYQPKTLTEAIDLVYSNLNTEEKTYLNEQGDAGLHFGIGRIMRNAWLWDKDNPLHQHFEKAYGLGHADDMSGIIFEGLVAKVRGKDFDAVKSAQHYKDYWIKEGIDPLTQESIV